MNEELLQIKRCQDAGYHRHTHATGPDASVLIVENADVSPENSDHIPVNVGWLFRREEEK